MKLKKNTKNIFFFCFFLVVGGEACWEGAATLVFVALSSAQDLHKLRGTLVLCKFTPHAFSSEQGKQLLGWFRAITSSNLYSEEWSLKTTCATKQSSLRWYAPSIAVSKNITTLHKFRSGKKTSSWERNIFALNLLHYTQTYVKKKIISQSSSSPIPSKVINLFTCYLFLENCFRKILWKYTKLANNAIQAFVQSIISQTLSSQNNQSFQSSIVCPEPAVIDQMRFFEKLFSATAYSRVCFAHSLF